MAAELGNSPGVSACPMSCPRLSATRSHRVPALTLAALRPLQRRPRPADQHREPAHLRQRAADGGRAQRPLRLGLHARALRPEQLQAVNDSAGHAFGDQLLRQFGFALRLSVRNGDNAARIGATSSA